MENEHYAFITDCLADPHNAEKQQALEQWLTASAENQALFEEAKMLWDTAARLPATPLDQVAGWEALSQQLSNTPPAAAVRTRRMATGWFKAAAVLLPLLTAAGYWFYHTKQNSRVAYTAIHAKDSLVLPDGTAVYLRQGAQVSWRRNFSERHVQLEAGEAFFKIAKDEAHPFSINTTNAIVKVLGTAFNVKRTATYTDLVVWEGKVSLSGDHQQPVMLGPGEMGIVEGDKGPAAKQQGDHRNRCAWASHELVFNNQSLAVVVRELNDYYQFDLKVYDTTLLDHRVTVRFSHLSDEEAYVLLSEVLDNIKLKKQDTLIH